MVSHTPVIGAESVLVPTSFPFLSRQTISPSSTHLWRGTPAGGRGLVPERIHELIQLEPADTALVRQDHDWDADCLNDFSQIHKQCWCD